MGRSCDPGDSAILEEGAGVAHPYSDLPDSAFWRRAVSELGEAEIDPVTRPAFSISRSDRVATAGSCFAQHLSRAIAQLGFGYLVTEAGPASPAAVDESYGVFSARFGNIYTTAQFLQLFERAYGLFAPQDDAWVREDGAVVDPFRPRIQAPGFVTVEAMREDREAHLAAVRAMFETCDVLVFTLGQTECWAAPDGAVVPLAPGAAGAPLDRCEYGFRNLTPGAIEADLLGAVDRLRSVNPAAHVVLTVSPVAMIATYEPRHVLESNGYSKAALRVAAEAVAQARAGVSYFPSYEIILGPAAGGRYLAPDRRNVTEEGVAHVMSIFTRHYLNDRAPAAPASSMTPAAPVRDTADLAALQGVVCDEESLDR